MWDGMRRVCRPAHPQEACDKAEQPAMTMTYLKSRFSIFRSPTIIFFSNNNPLTQTRFVSQST
jgi:hypothetical protein